MLASLTSDERNALTQFRKNLNAHFGKRIKDCRLFGSKAREEGERESDIDVLVLIENMRFEDKRWVITCGADISLEYLVEISPLCLSPVQFNSLLQRERRLALDIEKEGIPL